MFKLPDWWPRQGLARTMEPKANPLADFASEDPGARAPSGSPDVSASRLPTGLPLIILGLVVVVLVGYGVRKWRPLAVEAAGAAVTVESDPQGAQVSLAGVRLGVTPLTVPVAPGNHTFEVAHGERTTFLRVSAREGAPVVHHVKFDISPSASLRPASLRVVTEPSRLRVLLDGKPIGVSPVLATDLQPGRHRIQVVGGKTTLERAVDLHAGEAASVIVSAAVAPAHSGPAAGWLTVTSPVTLQIVEGGSLIGTSETAKLLLPAGKHDLRLANESLGIAERRTVQIAAGATASIKVQVPETPVSINALPWAEVWVDGSRIGETPIANHRLRVGRHEVLFRHPQLGERRQNVIVSLNAPARISVDLRGQ